jgi:hypothetical protein
MQNVDETHNSKLATFKSSIAPLDDAAKTMEDQRNLMMQKMNQVRLINQIRKRLS